ncbi:hypothetical protein CDG60_11230 [Acinetobacter chinensis]|uniref:Uncharacterized protein n=1 Tax=Acinetobacter chinensis TaxID=2004650 RepID=A0A3B7LYI7_9GAMM|nr:hypothetical protein CDG60_11230 [Acinetobacter chinensis]
MQRSVRNFEKKTGWLIHYLTGIFRTLFYLKLLQIFIFNQKFISTLPFSMSTVLIPFFHYTVSFRFWLFCIKNICSPTEYPKQSDHSYSFWNKALFQLHADRLC